MQISGFHLLLTYQCTYECDHCFVWGSPRQAGVMTIEAISHILHQAQETGTVNSIYFEGGEPFLYYATLLAGVKAANEMGFSVGIVSNAYWATSRADALAALEPLKGILSDLTVSSDLFHSDELNCALVRNAVEAAAELGIPTGTISIARPDDPCAASAVGQLPEGQSGVMYRGRAAAKLAGYAPHHAWQTFTECPHEDLREPGRLHVDPFGNLHTCQGIIVGNLFREPAKEIFARYRPEGHPVTGPLLAGGPAELALRYGLQPEAEYADACHLCDDLRRKLRGLFPAELGPDQMYSG